MRDPNPISWNERDVDNLWVGLTSMEYFYQGEDGRFYAFDSGQLNYYDEELVDPIGYPVREDGDGKGEGDADLAAGHGSPVENPAYMVGSEVPSTYGEPAPGTVPDSAVITNNPDNYYGGPVDWDPAAMSAWISSVRAGSNEWVGLMHTTASERLPEEVDVNAGHFTQGSQVAGLMGSVRAQYLANADILLQAYSVLLDQCEAVRLEYENADGTSAEFVKSWSAAISEAGAYMGGQEGNSVIIE